MRPLSMLFSRRPLATAIAILAMVGASALLFAQEAIAQSGGNLSFRSCWNYCGPSARGSNSSACTACLRRVCAQQPRLRSHPACRRVSAVPAPAPVQEEEPEPAPARAAAASGPVRCDVAACSERYRSFRASDCTYQPFEGPRRLCTRGNPQLVTVPAEPDEPADAATDTALDGEADDAPAAQPSFVDDELDIDPTVDEAPAPVVADDQLGCDYQACEQSYRSFRRSDCTYQPFEGPRRRCTKGDPIGAAARAAAAAAAAGDEAGGADGQAAADIALSAAESASPDASTARDDAEERARAELEIENTFDMIGNVVAPAGYFALAAILLLRVLFMRGAAAPVMEPEPAAGPRRGRSSDLLKESREGWRVERASRAAFGAGAAPAKDDPNT